MTTLSRKLNGLEVSQHRIENMIERETKDREDGIKSITDNGIYWSNAEKIANSEGRLEQLRIIKLILDKETSVEEKLERLKERFEMITDYLLRGPEISSTSMFSNAIGLAKYEANREIRRDLENIIYLLTNMSGPWWSLGALTKGTEHVSSNPNN